MTTIRHLAARNGRPATPLENPVCRAPGRSFCIFDPHLTDAPGNLALQRISVPDTVLSVGGQNAFAGYP